jgi:ribosomal protein S10
MTILKIRSVDQNSLIIYKKFLEDVLLKLVITYKVSNIPTTKKRVTLLKSPHVNKKSREQFQHTRYKVFFKINNRLDIKAIKYIISNKPKTVKIVLIRAGD